MKIIKKSIKKTELAEMAKEGFGDLIKAAVDIEQQIMAVGGEMHADAEVLLVEKAGSKRKDIWGINIYLEKDPGEWIEFDSMINLKPASGNRSRGVEDEAVRIKIMDLVRKLIVD